MSCVRNDTKSTRSTGIGGERISRGRERVRVAGWFERRRRAHTPVAGDLAAHRSGVITVAELTEEELRVKVAGDLAVTAAGLAPAPLPSARPRLASGRGAGSTDEILRLGGSHSETISPHERSDHVRNHEGVQRLRRTRPR